MIPELSDDGLLPPGIHRASIGEIERQFVKFDRSDRRFRIYAGLKRLIEEVRKLPFIQAMYLAGSFVSSKPEPNDFDCLLTIDGESFPQELRPFEYRIVSRRAAAKEFGGDVIAVVAGSELHWRYMDFFQTSRDGTPVGMIELIP